MKVLDAIKHAAWTLPIGIAFTDLVASVIKARTMPAVLFTAAFDGFTWHGDACRMMGNWEYNTRPDAVGPDDQSDWSQVEGPSMQPTFNPNSKQQSDWVLVEKVRHLQAGVHFRPESTS